MLSSVSAWVSDLTLLASLGYIGAAANITMGIPQIRRVRRDGLAGLSSTAMLTWAACNIAWASWGVAVGDLPVIISCGFGAIAPMWVLLRGVRAHHVQRRWAVPVVALAAASPVTVGVTAAGWLATSLSVSYNLPQLAKTLTRRDPAGLSPGRYSLDALRSGSWVIYGVYAGLAPLAASSVIQLTTALLLLGLALALHRRATVTVTHTAPHAEHRELAAAQ